MKQKLNLSNKVTYLLVIILALQILWLGAIRITGASENLSKLLGLGIYSLLCGIIVISLPERIITKIRLYFQNFIKSEKRIVFSLVILVLIIGIPYAIEQRIWTWDEEKNLQASSLISEKGLSEFFASYGKIPWLGTQHPPLIPIINGYTMRLFGENLLTLRLVSLSFTLGLLLLTYYIGRELYDTKIGFLGALLLITFPLIMRIGTAALTDIQVTFFFTFSILMILILLKRPIYSIALATGIIVGFGLLSKYTMVFLAPVMFVCLLTSKSFRRVWLQLGVVASTSLIILGSWLLFAYISGILTNQITTTSAYAGGVLRWTVNQNMGGINWMFNSLLTKLPSATGIYNIPLILLGGYILLKHRSHSDRFLLIWIVTFSLILIFSLPDHRYFLPVFPALCIAMAVWLKNHPEFIERAIILSVLLAGGSLYLFVNWNRVTELFVR